MTKTSKGKQRVGKQMKHWGYVSGIEQTSISAKGTGLNIDKLSPPPNRERTVVVLNKTQMKNKELVKQFISGGFDVIENKKVPHERTKEKQGDKQKKVVCPYCNKEAIWCENKEVYGRNYGKSYMCYYCKPCDAYVGCHNNTKIPLGTMANKELRDWRKKAHKVIDPLWREKGEGMKRSAVYIMLDKHFGREIHIGKSDIETCRQVISFIQSL